MKEGIWKAVWFGIFHSVSAFCNAGFALQSDSLISFRHNISVLGPIAVLVVLGGLGFVPLSVLVSRFFGRRHRLDLHTKVALAGTAAFLLLGAFGAWLLQYAQAERSMSLGDAMFWSVTLRTAGIQSYSDGKLEPRFCFVVHGFYDGRWMSWWDGRRGQSDNGSAFVFSCERIT